MSRRYSKEDVFHALFKAHAVSGAPVHRQSIAQSSEIPMDIVDDHIKALVNDARVVRRERGFVEPIVVVSPPRAVSVTYLPDGRAKVEMGDYLIELCPKELVLLARLIAGCLLQKAN